MTRKRRSGHDHRLGCAWRPLDNRTRPHVRTDKHLPEKHATETPATARLVRAQDTERMRTAFTISVDARNGVTTGISAKDRARTVRALVDSATEPNELVRPGHIFPLRYTEGGVLRRPGHTEAAVDLARLAGLAPAGALAEVVNDDGTMARLPALRAFADEHGLALISIAQLIRFRRHSELTVRRVV